MCCSNLSFVICSSGARILPQSLVSRSDCQEWQMWRVAESQSAKSLVLRNSKALTRSGKRFFTLDCAGLMVLLHYILTVPHHFLVQFGTSPLTGPDDFAIAKTMDQASEQASTYQRRTKWWTSFGRFDLYFCRHASILSDKWILHWIAQHNPHKQLSLLFSKQNASKHAWFGWCTFGYNFVNGRSPSQSQHNLSHLVKTQSKSTLLYPGVMRWPLMKW